MPTLQRHIFLSVLGTCATAVGLFAFVMVGVSAARDLFGYVFAGQLGAWDVTRLVLLLFPFVLTYALPMGLLTGVLLVLGRLSAQQEITAMRAAGLGFGYIARPVFFLGSLAVVLALAINYSYLPRARTAYHELLSEALQASPLAFLVPKTFIRDFPGVVVYVGDKQGTVLRDCWVWRLDDHKRVIQLVRANSGRIDYDLAEGKLLLTLTDATGETRDAKDPEDFSSPPPVAALGEAPFELKNFLNPQIFTRKQAWLSLDELLAERVRLAALAPTRDNERAAMQVQITLNEKGAMALAAFSLTLLAVPLGIRVSRKETSANLAVAVLCALGYYFLTVMVGWLGRHPELRPDLLLWVPNLVLLAVGGVLFWRLDRR
jgi:lipopolysaccharide export system permease protein